MEFPSDWAQVQVTGSYRYADGSPAIGCVEFHSPPLQLGSLLIAATRIVADLDGDGNCSVALAATDDPRVQPSGWAWRVCERIRGSAARSYAIAVPAAGGAVDLGVAPVVLPELALGMLSTVARTGQAADLVGLDEVLAGYGDGDPTAGITQAAADLRYIRLAQINAANGVAGLNADTALQETQLPLPPVTLTVLLENKLA